MRWLRSLVAPAEIEARDEGDLALEAVEEELEAPKILPAPPPPSSRLLEEAMAKHDKADFIRWLYATPKKAWTLEGCSKTFYGHLFKPAGKQKFYSYDHAEIALHALHQGARPSRREMPALLALLLKQSDHVYSWPFERLLDMGAHPRMKVKRHRRWLDEALIQGKHALALLLLERGAPLTDRQGNLRHDVFPLMFKKQSQRDHFDSMAYKMSLSDMYDWHERSSIPDLPQSGFDVESKGEELVLALIQAGLDVNHASEDGSTAYALAEPQMRKFLEANGALPQGRGAYGLDIAAHLLGEGKFKELEKLLAHNPNALLAENADGTLAVRAWWGLPPDKASAALAWFKAKGIWHSILGAHDRHGRNFLTAGLAMMIKKGPDKDNETVLAHQLEWRLGRLETEIHSSMWVDPDQGGETLNFWLGVARAEGLMAKYVLPRRELMLKAALAHVDQTLESQPSNQSRRARL